MSPDAIDPVVHLELRTPNLARACGFYTRLFGWRAETVYAQSASSYLELELGAHIRGGVAERDAGRSLWLPYVEVADAADTVDRARSLGAAVLLEPREGPAGWRAVLEAPAGGEVALWQPKP